MSASLAPDDGPAGWSNKGFAQVARLASERAGLTFPENRRDITESALRRAMAHAGVRDPVEFAERVSRDEGAYADAITELTVGETYFFRDPAQWDLIRREIVPELLRTHPDGRGVRAWSAGSSRRSARTSLNAQVARGQPSASAQRV